ncbi:hypothetical protein CARUB_v10021316mg [Capsella rubella]|uniref:F-box domain-containing protein n=1 Tax=Capsella rubella TaxID=81985 RepID=R0I6Y5_9BRAS|nr:hypothetical protein CARUB_v10021316mg [Capsella rubella]
MENSSFDTVFSLDLQKHIMSFFTLKSLAKCICVSKQWASLIRGEDFAKVYLTRSVDRPRLMFMVSRDRTQPPEPEMSWFHDVCENPSMETLFHSVYLKEKEEPLLSSGQQQLRISYVQPITCSALRPVQGLVCLHLDNQIVICNPGAKTFRKLPEVDGGNSEVCINCFLGYDKATDVFKVLCISLYDMSETPITTYQVCTIRSTAGEESWRPITCEYGHKPCDDGLFIDGVLYYKAERYSDKARVIMSFNVMSEEFSVIELSEQVSRGGHSWDLVNYNEEIALPAPVGYNTSGLQMWVRDQMGEWLLRSIPIPPWKQTVEDKPFYFVGNINRTNELVFTDSPSLGNQNLPYIVLLYDTNSGDLRRFKIEEVKGHYVETFVDHVDSTWLI